MTPVRKGVSANSLSRAPAIKSKSGKDRQSQGPRPGTPRYVLRLYVAGISPSSSAAIQAITAICEDHLKDRYDLEVVDIYRQPTLTRGEQIIAVPALIKKLPLPLRRLIGNMADTQRVLVGLDLKTGK